MSAELAKRRWTSAGSRILTSLGTPGACVCAGRRPRGCRPSCPRRPGRKSARLAASSRKPPAGVSEFRLEASWDVVSCQLSVVSGQLSVVSGQWSVVSGQWSAGAAGIRSGCVGAGLGVLNPVFRLDSWKPTFCSWKPASGRRRWLPAAARLPRFDKKSRTPTGRGDKKRERPRLALRRPTPSWANLACTCGIRQGSQDPNRYARQVKRTRLQGDRVPVTLL